MSDLPVIVGDLLASKASIIGHQCNCLTKGKAQGLAAVIFERYPYADVYAERFKPNVPGTSSLHGSAEAGEQVILNLYAQYYPGKSKYNSDSEEMRLRWLKTGLLSAMTTRQGVDLALPYGIGCGLAGGYWRDYETVLREVIRETGVRLTLYRREQDRIL